MRRVNFQMLKSIDYSIRQIDVTTWYWQDQEYSETPKTGRSTNGLLFLVNGYREYYADRRVVATSEADTLTFTPIGQCHSTRAFSQEGNSYGYTFRFRMYDETGEELCVWEPYAKVKDSASHELYSLCQKLGNVERSKHENPSTVRACVYALFSHLCEHDTQEQRLCGNFPDIMPAVRQMHAFPERHISLQEMCALCGMGETLFRRRFEEFSGVTPVQYRNELLCQKAEQLYCSRQGTLNQIAEQLELCDAGYLCRLYRKYRGKSFRDLKP